jgi:rhamnosyltransferase
MARGLCNIQVMAMRTPAFSDTRIIIPVRNGGDRWREAAQALRRCVPTPSMVVVIDSSSTDGSDIIAAELGFELERIDPRTFNHGRTRQNAVDRFCKGHSFVVFLTHDAIIEGSESLIELLSAFDDPRTGAAYGRQLPHYNAQPFARHSAAYLYPGDDNTRGLADAARYGIRTTHLSNSYAAYRLQALYECGGFPSALILGEDAHVALRMLQSGWTISYRATATVRHSHDYSLFQEMQRYFDYGVLHTQLPDLLTELGSPEGEGMRFVTSELRYVAASAPRLLPLVPMRNAAKYLGYRLGRNFKKLPNSVRRRLSMTRGFWDTVPVGGA